MFSAVTSRGPRPRIMRDARPYWVAGIHHWSHASSPLACRYYLDVPNWTIGFRWVRQPITVMCYAYRPHAAHGVYEGRIHTGMRLIKDGCNSCSFIIRANEARATGRQSSDLPCVNPGFAPQVMKFDTIDDDATYIKESRVAEYPAALVHTHLKVPFCIPSSSQSRMPNVDQCPTLAIVVSC